MIAQVCNSQHTIGHSNEIAKGHILLQNRLFEISRKRMELRSGEHHVGVTAHLQETILIEKLLQV
jgi:hypothetical protein